MNDTDWQTCIHCGRSEAEIPLTSWRLAGEFFWICPDCLPFLIHRRNEVMPGWHLTDRRVLQKKGEENAEG